MQIVFQSEDLHRGLLSPRVASSGSNMVEFGGNWNIGKTCYVGELR